MLSLIDRALQRVPPISRLVDSLAVALLPASGPSDIARYLPLPPLSQLG